MRVKRTFSLRMLLATTTLVCVIMASVIANWPAFPTMEAIGTVKAGMTEGQVRQILGKPYGTTQSGPPGKERTELLYPVGTFAQHQANIAFSPDGQVVETRLWHRGKRVEVPKP